MLQSTPDLIMAVVAVLAALSASINFITSRQDRIRLELMSITDTNRSTSLSAVGRLHERLDAMNDIVVRKDDLELIRTDIKDISDKLDVYISRST